MSINVKNKTLVDWIQQKRDCRRASCRVYASNLRRIHKEFSDKKFNFDLKWLKADASSILKKISKLQNVNIARNLMSSALVGFSLLKDEANIQKYNTVLKELNEKKNQLQREGIMTVKQQEVHVNWSRIVALRKLLTKEVRLAQLYKRTKVTQKDFNKIQRAFVLSLYTLLPPVRLDFADLEFISPADFDKAEDKTEKNYLVMARGGYKIYWNHFKTAKHMGEVVVLIKKYSPLLQRLMVTHIRYLKKHWPNNRNLLLTTNLSGERLTRNALTRFLQRLFKQYFRKNISSTALRRTFLSHKYDKSVIQEQEDEHRLMHHSRKTAIADYIRVNKAL